MLNNQEIILDVKNISKNFGGLKAVNEVSFSVRKGIIKSIIGPNGAGKTTIFNLISGTISASSGTIKFLDKELIGLKPYQIARLGLIRTFQNLKLCPTMTALENVMIGRHIRSKGNLVEAIFNLPVKSKYEKEIYDSAMEYLRLIGIENYAHYKAGNLPFGIQRGVELARALAAEPILLLLDEPASGLNIYETKELVNIILKIKEKGITILLIEHDMSVVMDISDEVLVLNFGKKIDEGIPKNIQRNPEVIKIYLGDENA